MIDSFSTTSPAKTLVSRGRGSTRHNLTGNPSYTLYVASVSSIFVEVLNFGSVGLVGSVDSLVGWMVGWMVGWLVG